MEKTILALLRQLCEPALLRTDVIHWGAPIPAFGNTTSARIATVGLNPSNKEFVDGLGSELQGEERRFHTLKSLHLRNWSNVERAHARAIHLSCVDYFANNPYDGWFMRLQEIIAGTGYSYYDLTHHACHLDLVPFATTRKWTELTSAQRKTLIDRGAETLGSVLRDSPIAVLIANGRGVIKTLEAATGAQFSEQHMPDWTLLRKSGRHVAGFAVTGQINRVAGIALRRKVQVVGFNHNIQSSFGVSTAVRTSISSWVTATSTRYLP